MKKRTCLTFFALLMSLQSLSAEQSQTPKADSSKPSLLTTADMLKSSATGNSNAPDPRRLLDVGTPISERRQIFSAYENLADHGNVKAQYIVGSLYRIGQKLPACPIQRDDAKAELYLSNAATHGEIWAMAKMAEIQLGDGHYLEAMNWAQILGHYVKSIPAEYRPSQGYIAELVARIDEKFDRSKMKDVVDDLNTFIVNYDESIKAGFALENQRKDGDPNEISRRNLMYSPGTFNPKFADQTPGAGFVDYLVEFSPDGTVKKTWILDSMPNPNLGKTLEYVAKGTHVNPSVESKDNEPRIAWLPVDFDDLRYRLTK